MNNANGIRVLCNGTDVSRINIGGTSNLGTSTVVDVSGTLTAGTYPIIVSTGTMSGTTPTLGTNTTGKTITFSRVGNTLNLIAV
jgi:hypothetical protein